mgnify:CR=1 FL=1
MCSSDLVHDMSIRLTLDHKFTIVDVEAVTDKSPYQICGNVAPDFKKLIGLRIGGGFHREVRARLGGVHGCTHIVELLGPVATTAFQTVSSGKARDLKRRGWRFVGPTTVYAFLQSMGLINDHVEGCVVRPEVEAARTALARPV